MNGDAVLVAIKMLAIGSVLLCLALVTHVVWIRDLARSHAYNHLGPATKIIILTLSAMTPVISFYVVESAHCLCRIPRRHSFAGACRVVFSTLGAIAAMALGFLVILLLRQPVQGARGSDVLSHLPGIFLVCAVPCAVLGMTWRILVRSRPARAGWITAGLAAACLILLV